MRSSGIYLGDFLSNRRGAPLQNSLCAEKAGRIAAWGGKQISRYGMAKNPKGFLSPELDHRALLPASFVYDNAIFAQNIVAHVMRPRGHLKIIATIAPAGFSGAILDTVNQLRCRACGHDPAFFLALLNSRLVSWYVYRFIVGKAVRTIHFDSPVTSRIPMPARINQREQDELAGLAREMLRYPSQKIDDEIDRLVCSAFDLGEGVARAIRV
jgi:hypothetical protein